MIQILDDKPGPTWLGQAGIGVAMRGCVRSGLVGRIANRGGLTPPCH